MVGPPPTGATALQKACHPVFSLRAGAAEDAPIERAQAPHAAPTMACAMPDELVEFLRGEPSALQGVVEERIRITQSSTDQGVGEGVQGSRESKPPRLHGPGRVAPPPHSDSRGHVGIVFSEDDDALGPRDIPTSDSCRQWPADDRIRAGVQLKSPCVEPIPRLCVCVPDDGPTPSAPLPPGNPRSFDLGRDTRRADLLTGQDPALALRPRSHEVPRQPGFLGGGGHASTLAEEGPRQDRPSTARISGRFFGWMRPESGTFRPKKG